MKATLALAVANAVLAAANPLVKRVYVTDLDIKTVTSYVYPDGSPATHLGAQATPSADDGAVFYETIAQPGNSNQETKPTSTPSSDDSDSDDSSSDSGSGSGSGSSDKPQSAVPATSYGSVQEASIQSHNAHRSNHSAPAVSWDSNLASYAQKLADSCSYGHDTKIGGGGYGQNIAMGAETNFGLSEGECATRAITRQWYNNEYELYPSYGGEPSMDDFEAWGHLSQMVWEGTEKIGCAIAICDGGELAQGMEGYFAVCNYAPAGNVIGKFSDNVKPARGAAIQIV